MKYSNLFQFIMKRIVYLVKFSCVKFIWGNLWYMGSLTGMELAGVRFMDCYKWGCLCHNLLLKKIPKSLTLPYPLTGEKYRI